MNKDVLYDKIIETIDNTPFEKYKDQILEWWAENKIESLEGFARYLKIKI